MAFFAGTGPDGKTCGDCKFRGYMRESRNGHWSDQLQQVVHNRYRVTGCQLFKKMAGHHGPGVEKDNPACKYWEGKSKP